MIDNVPLVGSMSTGFGSGSIENMAPTARSSNIVEASHDFVGMLYAYMFSQMRENSSNEEDGLFSGPHVNMLMGFLDQEIGKQLASTQGDGLAKQMMTQLTGRQNNDVTLENTLPEDAASTLGKLDTRTEGFSGPVVKGRFDVRSVGFSGPPVSGRFDTRSEGIVEELPSNIDNSQQIMQELDKLNRRE
jgi:Rod binding domain-containing protein